MFAPNLNLYYRITITDASGRVVRRTRLRRCRSYVKQFTQALLCRFSSANVATVKDTGGSLRTLKADDTIGLRTAKNTPSDLEGPVVGTGSVAVDISDYALGSLIGSGTGAGQLEYQIPAFSSHQVVGSTAQFTVTCTYINSSGATIPINEVGIYAIYRDSGSSARYFLIVRDVVSGGQAVLNGQSATLEYIIKAVV